MEDHLHGLPCKYRSAVPGRAARNAGAYAYRVCRPSPPRRSVLGCPADTSIRHVIAACSACKPQVLKLQLPYYNFDLDSDPVRRAVQVISVVTGGGPNGTGLFFPEGLNGAINGSSAFALSTLADTAGRRKLKVRRLLKLGWVRMPLTRPRTWRAEKQDKTGNHLCPRPRSMGPQHATVCQAGV